MPAVLDGAGLADVDAEGGVLTFEFMGDFLHCGVLIHPGIDSEGLFGVFSLEGPVGAVLDEVKGVHEGG